MATIVPTYTPSSTLPPALVSPGHMTLAPVMTLDMPPLSTTIFFIIYGYFNNIGRTGQTMLSLYYSKKSIWSSTRIRLVLNSFFSLTNCMLLFLLTTYSNTLSISGNYSNNVCLILLIPLLFICCNRPKSSTLLLNILIIYIYY